MNASAFDPPRRSSFVWRGDLEPCSAKYELVERIESYDPDTDEDLINRAHVYSVKVHGSRQRDALAVRPAAGRAR